MTWSDVRPIHALLAICVLAIWGGVLYQITASVSGDETVEGAAPIPDRAFESASVAPVAAYQGSFRDPFRITVKQGSSQVAVAETTGRASRASQPVERPRETPPAARQTRSLLEGYSLLGIVDETGIVQRPDQQVEMLRVDSEVNAHRVTYIGDQILVVATEDRRDTLYVGGKPRIALR